VYEYKNPSKSNLVNAKSLEDNWSIRCDHAKEPNWSYQGLQEVNWAVIWACKK